VKTLRIFPHIAWFYIKQGPNMVLSKCGMTLSDETLIELQRDMDQLEQTWVKCCLAKGTTNE
jgi:hypothetical protein